LNPLEIGSTVHWAGHDWTVVGERGGEDWPPELLEHVLLERDRHIDSWSGQPAFALMSLRVVDVRQALLQRVALVLRANRLRDEESGTR
jgi:hypothetical protein